MSQKQLGDKLKTSQPRVAKIEQAASDVSLDQLIRALTAAGGQIVVESSKGKATKKKRAASRKSKIFIKLTTAK